MTQDEDDQSDVGTLVDEAAKLLAALQQWSRESAAAEAGHRTASDLLRDLNEHIATGAEECVYCPLCQLIAAVRATSPEVKKHLTAAATSLIKASAGLLTPPPGRSRTGGTPVERIDLDDEGWEEQDR